MYHASQQRHPPSLLSPSHLNLYSISPCWAPDLPDPYLHILPTSFFYCLLTTYREMLFLITPIFSFRKLMLKERDKSHMAQVTLLIRTET